MLKLRVTEKANANVIKASLVGEWELEIVLGSDIVNLFSIRILREDFGELIEWFMKWWKRLMVGELSVWEYRWCCCDCKTVAPLCRTVPEFRWCCVVWWNCRVEKRCCAAATTLRALLWDLIKGLHFLFVYALWDTFGIYICISLTFLTAIAYWICWCFVPFGIGEEHTKITTESLFFFVYNIFGLDLAGWYGNVWMNVWWKLKLSKGWYVM